MYALSLFSYNVPPSVQILLSVHAVAYGEPSSQACFSISFSLPSGVYDTSHLLEVCFSNSARISSGVVVKEFTINTALREASRCCRAPTTSLPTLPHFQSHAEDNLVQRDTHSAIVVKLTLPLPSPSSTAFFALTSNIPISSFPNLPKYRSEYGPVTRYVNSRSLADLAYARTFSFN